jgi:hypothetical protein
MSRQLTPAASSTLDPADIRRIREKLGISQVEAGELLGGGPRAFTKYESGTIKPAASVSNLLRMVDANPAALITLSGRKLPPIESDGSKPFEVTGEHVAALSERKLVNLMRRLLAAEAQGGALPMDGIHVAAVVTAPDGGEDAKIEWTDGPDRTAFLPSRYSQFQLKASDLSPAEAGDEVLTGKGAVKPMVKASLDAGGTYTLICGRSYTNKKIKAREERIRISLKEAGMKFRPEQVRLRDADQLALWVNAHPPVAAWLLEQTQPGLVGTFKDWTHWAGRYDAVRWIDDARLEPLRENLRALVARPQGVARVLGLSGYGKSRLVHEALRPTDEEVDGPRLSDLVLYAVESEAGTTAIKNIVQGLVDAGVRAIIAVDRCMSETHQDLAAMVKRAGSRLSLVTIDHELPSTERLPEGVLLVPRADDVVIEAMIKQIAPNLPSEDQRRLVKFSQGFPQIATLLGQSWLKDASIAGASDEDLFDRIILGRNPIEAPLLRDAGMLLSAFGLLGVKAPLNDLDVVAPLSRQRSADDLRAAFDQLKQRGVVQQHGRLLSLQPKPLAMALAEQQWRVWNETRWDDILAGSLPAILRRNAAEQLALINNTAVAMEVTQYVCRLNGPFASISAFEDEGASGVISALAEIDADAVLTLLDRVFGALTTEQLKGVAGQARRHLVWALEKIAFLEPTFEKAALLLLSFATAENETWGNNSTGQFKRLFPVFLSDTAAGPEVRLRLLDELIAENDTARMPIVVDALLKGADLSSPHRMVGAEIHGSRPALEPWQPKLWKDAWDYVLACMDRLAKLAVGNGAIAERARSGMPHCFRTLVSSAGLVDRVEGWVRDVATVHRYWPEALNALGDILEYDAAGLKDGVADRVRKLIEFLSPEEPADRVRFLVTEMPWDYPVGEKLGYEERALRQNAAVEALAQDLLKQPDELKKLLPQLSVGDQRMSAAFGGAIAKFSEDPYPWAHPISATYAEAQGNRNFGLLTGFFSGMNARDAAFVEEFKRMATGSTVFSAAFPYLCLRIGITASDVELACKALAAGTIAPHQMIHWSMGGELAKLSPAAVKPLFDQLLNMGDDAYPVVLDLIGMYVHGNAPRLEELRLQLVSVARGIGKRQKRRGSQMDAHHFEQIMGWLLDKGREDPDARAAAVALATYAASHPDGDGNSLLKPVLPVLLSKFASVIWPVFGQAIVANRATGWHLQHLLGDTFSFAETKRPPILNVPEDILFTWCHAYPNEAPAFLATIVPVLTARQSEAGENTLHPIVKRLLDEFGQREDVLKRLVQNMHTFGWSGSRTTYYALYEAPLRSLENHPIGAVRRWAHQMLNHMRAEIQSAKTEDDEQRAQWDI